MASISVEEALERARRATEDRMESVRHLAEARADLDRTRAQCARELEELTKRNAERIAAAERADVVTYGAALAAGWSAVELRKIGYAEPAKQARVTRRRRTTATKPSETPPPAHETAPSETPPPAHETAPSETPAPEADADAQPIPA